MENKFVKMSQIDYKEEMDGQGNYTFFLQYNDNEKYINELADITEEHVDEYCKYPVDNYYGKMFKLTGKMLHVPIKIEKYMDDCEQTMEIDQYLYKNGICDYFPEIKYTHTFSKSIIK